MSRVRFGEKVNDAANGQSIRFWLYQGLESGTEP